MKLLHLLQKYTVSIKSWLPLALLIAVSAGASLGMGKYAAYLWEFQEKNVLSKPLLSKMILTSSVIIGITILIYFVGALLLKKYKHKPLEESVHLFNRIGSILLVIPVFLLFDTVDLAKDHPFVTLFGCFLIALITGIWVYRLPSLPWNRIPLQSVHYKWIAISIIGTAAAGFAVVITQFSLQHIENLQVGNYDLGVYVNTLWNTANGDLLRSTIVRGGYHIYAHFDPILILFSPVMWFDPKPDNAIIAQSVWLAFGVVPLYKIAMFHLKNNGMATILCFAYLLYPGVHGPAMFDFHSITLAGPLILWAMYFADAKKNAAYWVTIGILLLTREDLGLIMFFVGFYLFYGGSSLKTGVITMLVCLGYYLCIKNTVMATSKNFSYDHYFEALRIPHRSLGESLLVTFITNPMFIVRQALTEAKVEYMLQLLLPLLGLPLFAGKKCLVFFYGLIVTALVSRWAVYNIAYQYTTFLYPFFFALTPTVLKNVPGNRLFKNVGLKTEKLKTALVFALLASSIAVSYNYGVFHENSAFKDGQSHFDRNPSKFQIARYKTVQKLQKMIPADASISATHMIGAHFAIRPYIYQFKLLRETDYYLVLDKDVLKRRIKNKYKTFLKEKKYDLIFQENEIKVFIRKDLNKGKYPVLKLIKVDNPKR